MAGSTASIAPHSSTAAVRILFVSIAFGIMSQLAFISQQ